MKLKKIIAREFLYLISTTILLIIVFTGLKSYNIYQEWKANQITNERSLLESSFKLFLSRPLKVKNEKINQEKLDKLVSYVFANPNTTKEDIHDSITEFNNDSLLIQALSEYISTSYTKKYEHKKEQNLKFPEFFIIEQSDIDSVQYFNARINFLKRDILKTKSNLLTPEESKNYLIKIGLILSIIIFGIRYLYYATKWSLMTIKNK